MRHLKRKRNLGMSPSHRSSLLANLAASILDKEHIITTIAKAKEVRGVVERLITFGKKGGLHALRLAAKTIRDKTLLKKLFTDIAPSFKDREGGYTRIIKLGERKGDNALTVIFELVGRGAGEIARKRKKQKKEKMETDQAKGKKTDSAQKTAAHESAPSPKPAPAKKQKQESKKKEAAGEKSAAAETPEAHPAEKPKKAKKAATPKKTKIDKE